MAVTETSSIFYTTPKMLDFTMLFNWLDTQTVQVHLPAGAYMSPCYTYSLDPPDTAFKTAPQSRFSHFCTAHGSTLYIVC